MNDTKKLILVDLTKSDISLANAWFKSSFIDKLKQISTEIVYLGQTPESDDMSANVLRSQNDINQLDFDFLIYIDGRQIFLDVEIAKSTFEEIIIKNSV